MRRGLHQVSRSNLQRSLNISCASAAAYPFALDKQVSRRKLAAQTMMVGHSAASPGILPMSS